MAFRCGSAMSPACMIFKASSRPVGTCRCFSTIALVPCPSLQILSNSSKPCTSSSVLPLDAEVKALPGKEVGIRGKALRADLGVWLPECTVGPRCTAAPSSKTRRASGSASLLGDRGREAARSVSANGAGRRFSFFTGGSCDGEEFRRCSRMDEVVEGDDVAIPICGVSASPNAALEHSSLGSNGGVRT